MEIKNFVERIVDAAFSIREQSNDRNPWRALDIPCDLKELAISVLGEKGDHHQCFYWLHAIMQDILLRHITFNGKDDDTITRIVSQIEEYISSGQVELHTVVPVIGLDLDILYGEELKITDTFSLRKIPKWEWSWMNTMLRQYTYNANHCFEMVIRIEPEKIDWNIDVDNIRQNTKLLLGNLQMLHPVGMSTPWIIQYFPICQFVSGMGNISSASFSIVPGDRSYFPFSRANIEYCFERVNMLKLMDRTFQRRIEIALLRYQDSANRLNSNDAIMDYWIALEALLGGEDTKYGTARRLSAKIAVLLYECFEEQYELLIWLVRISYNYRNRITHGSDINDIDAIFEIIGKMPEIIKDCIEVILERQESFETLNQKLQPDTKRLVERYDKEFGKR